ncbi:L,D-transpeptidase family protein [Nocardioides soli]|uniref:L,D-peptidoglycan transpeptidase YkuD (ErfK/YbiS/YcfS/YnhG family) n=1 Tax=Nocardioides soli TaxID=1036020 RepID=A0A7W4Z0H7_9ACTN|nr:L,D-peptidoglycan transpeptidase YkuD (ErfK/YbiS/YcfS/YnhG family) [Nocardioides soli]
MPRRLGAGLALALLTTLLVAAPIGAATGSARVDEPAWARGLPARTTQVVRTVSSRTYCRQVWCTVTQAWERGDDGVWTMRREFRSTIGSRGWGKQREGDRRSPLGVFRIKVTFTTTPANPGRMPWRQRRATSVVSAAAGPNYNTWLEVRGVTSGNRPSMRSGWVLDFNHVRLRPGAGARPVPGKGSGIFYHTSKPGHPWAPTAGCTQVGNPQQMRWLLTWLRPAAQPRVVQER